MLTLSTSSTRKVRLAWFGKLFNFMCYSWQNSNQIRKLFVSHQKHLVLFVGWGPMVVHWKRCFYSLRVPCSNWNLWRNFQIVIFHFSIRLIVSEYLTINISIIQKKRVFYLQPTLQVLQPTRAIHTVKGLFFSFVVPSSVIDVPISVIQSELEVLYISSEHFPT